MNDSNSLLQDLLQSFPQVQAQIYFKTSLTALSHAIELDSARQFRGFWTFDPDVSRQAALLLCQRIGRYRPDLAQQIELTKQRYPLTADRELLATIATQVSIALMQAEAFVHLQQLNQQLVAIKQTQTNPIAIVGQELRAIADNEALFQLLSKLHLRQFDDLKWQYRPKYSKD